MYSSRTSGGKASFHLGPGVEHEIETLLLWSEHGSVARLYDDPPAIWREWADDVRGVPIPVGHFIPEEAPERTTRELLAVLR